MLAPEQPDGKSGEPASGGRPAIAELAEARLGGSGYPALRNVCCDYHGGALTLKGCLPSYYLKQVALAAVAEVEGVERVVDGIEVLTPAAGEPRRAGNS